MSVSCYKKHFRSSHKCIFDRNICWTLGILVLCYQGGRVRWRGMASSRSGRTSWWSLSGTSWWRGGAIQWRGGASQWRGGASQWRVGPSDEGVRPADEGEEPVSEKVGAASDELCCSTMTSYTGAWPGRLWGGGGRGGALETAVIGYSYSVSLLTWKQNQYNMLIMIWNARVAELPPQWCRRRGGRGATAPQLLDIIAPYNLTKKRFLYAVCQPQ